MMGERRKNSSSAIKEKNSMKNTSIFCADLNDYSACLRLFLSGKAKVVPNRAQDIKNDDNSEAAPTEQDKQDDT